MCHDKNTRIAGYVSVFVMAQSEKKTSKMYKLFRDRSLVPLGAEGSESVPALKSYPARQLDHEW